jgi:hypothetical protein
MPAADSHVGVHGSHINIRSIAILFHMLSPAADWTSNISRHLSNLRGEFEVSSICYIRYRFRDSDVRNYFAEYCPTLCLFTSASHLISGFIIS